MAILCLPINRRRIECGKKGLKFDKQTGGKIPR